MANYIDEYRDLKKLKILSEKLKNFQGKKIKIMEVCGTHTMAIFKYGIRNLLPSNIDLISGPGCPVCVTPVSFINTALMFAEMKDFIILTFGDLMRVPGTKSSLLRKKSEGADIRIIYSPLDSVNICRENPNKKILLLSVGFETTNPVIALTLMKIKEESVSNFFVLTANKTVPNIFETLLSDTTIGINGFLYPGHVSAVIGTKIYNKISKEYNLPGIISGFEPYDLILSILKLAILCNTNNNIVENTYSRVVKECGNQLAVEKINEVFIPCDSTWRGIGNVQNSGLRLNKYYVQYDAWSVFHNNIKNVDTGESTLCKCGDILKGKISPFDCPLFSKACTPINPLGACMVSSEGTCSAFYKYGGDGIERYHNS